MLADVLLVAVLVVEGGASEEGAGVRRADLPGGRAALSHRRGIEQFRIEKWAGLCQLLVVTIVMIVVVVVVIERVVEEEGWQRWKSASSAVACPWAAPRLRIEASPHSFDLQRSTMLFASSSSTLSASWSGGRGGRVGDACNAEAAR